MRLTNESAWETFQEWDYQEDLATLDVIDNKIEEIEDDYPELSEEELRNKAIELLEMELI